MELVAGKVTGIGSFQTLVYLVYWLEKKSDSCARPFSTCSLRKTALCYYWLLENIADPEFWQYEQNTGRARNVLRTTKQQHEKVFETRIRTFYCVPSVASRWWGKTISKSYGVFNVYDSWMKQHHVFLRKQKQQSKYHSCSLVARTYFVVCTRVLSLELWDLHILLQPVACAELPSQ